MHSAVNRARLSALEELIPGFSALGIQRGDVASEVSGNQVEDRRWRPCLTLARLLSGKRNGYASWM